MTTKTARAYPDFITHYSRGEAFLSISKVAKNDLQSVLRQLNESNAWGLNRFSDPEYLPRRISVEQKIRNEFLLKGGRPELEHPIYFFLGRSAKFEEHKKNIGYKINLMDLPATVISFTYGDSMFSLHEEYRYKLGGEYLSELCSGVYHLQDLEDLYSVIGNKSDRLHVECQLWAAPSAKVVSRIE